MKNKIGLMAAAAAAIYGDLAPRCKRTYEQILEQASEKRREIEAREAENKQRRDCANRNARA